MFDQQDPIASILRNVAEQVEGMSLVPPATTIRELRRLNGAIAKALARHSAALNSDGEMVSK